MLISGDYPVLVFQAPHKLWITADLHFHHANILTYCKRPFSSVEEMDSQLIKNINDLVDHNDILIDLGDVTCHGDPTSFLDQINCQTIYRTWGNHDNKKIAKHPKTKYIADRIECKVMFGEHAQHVVLDHYAMKAWNKSHYGSWQLYGHSHGGIPDDPTQLSFDVGVDCHNYKPINFLQVKEIISKKTWESPFVKWTAEGKCWKPENRVESV
jgi:calcineurin-like phosphoesterase family protein